MLVNCIFEYISSKKWVIIQQTVASKQYDFSDWGQKNQAISLRFRIQVGFEVTSPDLGGSPRLG